MQGPTKSTPSHDLVVIGLHHLAAFEFFFEETAPQLDGFREVNDQLTKALDARVASERSRAPRVARLPLVDVALDTLMMAFAEVVRRADGDTPGPLGKAFFPAGVERVVEPVGVVQAEEVRRILEELKGNDDAESLRDPWHDVIAETLAQYDEAIALGLSAESDLDAAKKAEEGARKAWFDAVEKHCEVIGESYPDSDFTRVLFFSEATVNTGE